jgi:MYXO-CTERM domain-containing protein
MLQTVRFGSEAAKYGLAPGDAITAVLVPADRPSRYWFALPALALLAGIVALQRRRQRLRVALAH